MSPSLQSCHGLRIAVEGCGHGTLKAIYASIKTACAARGWEGVDLLIIGGDFQAVRNAQDLTIMSCPVKYRAIGDFHAYYSGSAKAPYLTIFVGGNHEASNHLWELYYGGWVSPSIYYMGAANVVRLGGVRIAGMSGIWKGYNYNKPHHERLPYNQDDVKSIYHVRELDIRKFLQLRTQVDIGISHDWPRAIEKSRDETRLFRMKPDFEQESKDGTLGNQAAAYVMDRLRPPYWFAAHMHCKFAATKIYESTSEPRSHSKEVPAARPAEIQALNSDGQMEDILAVTHNTYEIDLDLDEEAAPLEPQATINGNPSSVKPGKATSTSRSEATSSNTSVAPDVRAQLPAAFSRGPPSQRTQPGQPVPPGITNKTVRFLALDKCLPSRQFLQLLEVQPHSQEPSTEPILSETSPRERPKFEYDPEWLAITRAFASDLILGDKNARPSQDHGEDQYRPLIDNELQWVRQHVVDKGKLEIPENFQITSPPFEIGMPEIVAEGPREYNNPQMQQFCDLVGIKNRFFATEEEQEQRLREGPAAVEQRGNGGFGGRGARGRGFGDGSRRGYGRGRGRGQGPGR